jgi:hypothetical protein
MKTKNFKVGGIAVKYQRCPTCPKLRPDEEAIVINPEQKQCRWCYGIEWQKAWRRKLKPCAKAKAGGKK